jgi:putative FmdB family regulatory protein
MPTYTYQCSDCGVSFEQFQRFSDDPLTTCPSCTGNVRRVIHPVGVVFKGSGWYINDSRKSSSTTTPAVDSTTSSEPAAKSAAPEAKPEAKPEPKPAEAKVAD